MKTNYNVGNSPLHVVACAPANPVILISMSLIVLIGIGWSLNFLDWRSTAIFVVFAATLAVLFRWPSSPIVVMYPLIWFFYSYQFEFVRGQPERIVGILGIAGMIMLMHRLHLGLAVMPSFVKLGVFVLWCAYLFSWTVHPSSPRGAEFMISLTTRLVFFYLVCFHLHTRKQLRWSITLFIATGFAAALLTLWASIEYGFGFTRSFEKAWMVSQELGPFLSTIIATTTTVSVVAIFVFGLYSEVRLRLQKVLVLMTSLFLFWMAFVAQYRRELLITIPVVLFPFAFDRLHRLRRPVLAVLGISIALFFVILFPTELVQERLADPTYRSERGIETRLMSLEAGTLAFFESPLYGFGPGSFELAVFPLLGSGLDQFQYYAYNVFVWVAVEAGSLGLVGLLLILFGVYREIKSARPHSSDIEGWILRVAPAIMLQILIWYSFGNAWGLSLPWFILGIIIAAARISKEEMRSIKTQAI